MLCSVDNSALYKVEPLINILFTLQKYKHTPNNILEIDITIFIYTSHEPREKIRETIHSQGPTQSQLSIICQIWQVLWILESEQPASDTSWHVHRQSQTHTPPSSSAGSSHWFNFIILNNTIHSGFHRDKMLIFTFSLMLLLTFLTFSSCINISGQISSYFCFLLLT